MTDVSHIAPEKPSLTVVDGAPAGKSAHADSDSVETSPEHIAILNSVKKNRRKSKSNDLNQVIPPSSSIAVSLTAEDVEADKNALAAFRVTLSHLVQRPAIDPSSLPRVKPTRLWRRLSSASLYGTQMSFYQLVGKYASLLPVLEGPDNLRHSEMALMGMLALQSGRTDIAQSILEEVRFLTSSSVALVYVMRGITRFVIFGGLAVVFVLYGFVFLYYFNSRPSMSQVQVALQTQKFDPEVSKVAAAILFGCLGSVVSLLLRIGEFETMRGRSREFLVLSGATLPIVGGIFAAVIASLFSAKIINLGSEFSIWLYIVIGFLSGFSERFTRNLLSMAENRLAGAPSRNRADAR
jgi:hypothetical protein